MYYDDEEKYLRSLKQEDSYHFSIPFEYIQKKYVDISQENLMSYKVIMSVSKYLIEL